VLGDDQRSLLDLLSEGATVGEAAGAVHLSTRTAHRRLQQARIDLGVATNAQAVLALRRIRRGGPALIGRELELAEIDGALRDGRSVVVVGAAGVGKTALLDAALAASDRPVRRGAGLASRQWESFGPLVDAVESLPAGGDAPAVAEDVQHTLDGELLVIDDIQWADAGTLEVLERVGGRLSVLCSARRSSTEEDATRRLSEAGWVVVTLSPLRRQAAEQLLRARRPDVEQPDVEPILEAAGGNPLLLLSLGGRDEVSTLKGFVQAQLQQVSDGARRALATLGVAECPLPIDQLPEEAAELLAIGLADRIGVDLWPRHQLYAVMAAELLAPSEIATVRQHLAVVRPAGESARHLEAAGDRTGAVVRAMEAAVLASTPGERAAHLELAAHCADGEEAVHLSLGAVDAHLAAGAIDRAVALLDQLRPSAGLESEVQLRRAQACWLSADPEGARRAAAAGLRTERDRRTPTELRLRVEELRLPIRVDWDADLALALGAAAVALADEVGVERATTRALLASAYLISGAGDGLGLLDEALRIAREEVDLDAELAVGHSLSTTRLLLGPPAEARGVAAELERRAERAHRGHWRSQFRFHRLLADLLGDPGDGVLAEVADLLDAGSPEVRAWAEGIAPYAVAIAHFGRIGEARRLLADAMGGGVGDDTGRCLLLWATAEVEFADGRPEAAVEAAARCLEVGPAGFFLKALARLVRGWALLELGRPVEVDGLPEIFPVFGPVIEEAAALAQLDSAPSEAADAFRDLAGAYEGVSARAELRCRWGHGEGVRRDGREAEAVDILRATAVLASDRGFVAAERSAHASLRALGVPDRAATVRSDGPLTRREDQVLLQVADGATSSDIARRLGVAVTTVESSIGSAMRKLGATTRRQAVALHLNRPHDA
jgi:DNA-binding CsgD family transcriptional regulator